MMNIMNFAITNEGTLKDLLKLRGKHLYKSLFLMMLHCTKNEVFPLRISSINVTKSAVVTFTEEIRKGKLHFLCSVTN